MGAEPVIQLLTVAVADYHGEDRLHGTLTMGTTYQHIDARRHEDLLIVHLQQQQMDDLAVRAMSAEIEGLLDREKCRQLILSLGRVQCVYSVLISRLIKLHQLVVEEHGGRLVLCDLSADAHAVLASCRLQDFFTIAADEARAIALLSAP